MNQEKIGKFIAELRKEKNMTQEQLAEKVGVTNKSVSRWENGKTLPDYSLLNELCNTLNISVNELLTGEKISDADYKKKADENLMIVLENSSFSLKKRIVYYKNKWLKEHVTRIIFGIILWIGILIGLKLNEVDVYILGLIGGILPVFIYIILYNQMMVYVENNVYRKNNK
ncbi:MAG TPA: helix-turn-helix transcriptional regulator [Clostridia bacterium]|nr:helix-turn-helix transcriptional regulator [Clostridia bacterium]